MWCPARAHRARSYCRQDQPRPPPPQHFASAAARSWASRVTYGRRRPLRRHGHRKHLHAPIREVDERGPRAHCPGTMACAVVSPGSFMALPHPEPIPWVLRCGQGDRPGAGCRAYRAAPPGRAPLHHPTRRQCAVPGSRPCRRRHANHSRGRHAAPASGRRRCTRTCHGTARARGGHGVCSGGAAVVARTLVGARQVRAGRGAARARLLFTDRRHVTLAGGRTHGGKVGDGDAVGARARACAHPKCRPKCRRVPREADAARAPGCGAQSWHWRQRSCPAPGPAPAAS